MAAWAPVTWAGSTTRSCREPEGGALQVFGTDGNLIFGVGYTASSSPGTAACCRTSTPTGGSTSRHAGMQAGQSGPAPTPGAFNYYHASTQHLIDCILEDREPVVNVDWGLHITEMMVGALESSRTGTRYDMSDDGGRVERWVMAAEGIVAQGLCPLSLAPHSFNGGTMAEMAIKEPFEPTWTSLRQFTCPDWFRDAKFGIWSHWGPQAVPMYGDWYARHMYEEGARPVPLSLAHVWASLEDRV